MQEFFDDAQLLLATDKADQSLIVELCLLCVHCLEVFCCCYCNYMPNYMLPRVGPRNCRIGPIQALVSLLFRCLLE